MRFELIFPLAKGAPLIFWPLDRLVAPHDRHARCERHPHWCGVEILEIERRHVSDLPTEMVVPCFIRSNGCIVTPRIRVMATCRQSQLQAFVHHGNRVLNEPIFGIHVGPQMPLVVAGDDGAGVASGSFQDAEAFRLLLVRAFIGSDIHEVCIHGLELPPVGRNGPRVEVVQLFVFVVFGCAIGVFPPLRLENAHNITPALDGVVLFVDCDEIVVEQNDSGGIADVCRRRGFCGIDHPIRRRLRSFFGSG